MFLVSLGDGDSWVSKKCPQFFFLKLKYIDFYKY